MSDFCIYLVTKIYILPGESKVIWKTDLCGYHAIGSQMVSTLQVVSNLGDSSKIHVRR